MVSAGRDVITGLVMAEMAKLSTKIHTFKETPTSLHFSVLDGGVKRTYKITVEETTDVSAGECGKPSCCKVSEPTEGDIPAA